MIGQPFGARRKGYVQTRTRRGLSLAEPRWHRAVVGATEGVGGARAVARCRPGERESSPSTRRPYGIARVVREWDLSRSTLYARRARHAHPTTGRHARRGRRHDLRRDRPLHRECVGIHAATHGDRFEALEPLRQGVRDHFGGLAPATATGLALRHDHGSVHLSADVQAEARFLGMTSSPAFVRQPEGNGCIESRSAKTNGDWSAFVLCPL